MQGITLFRAKASSVANIYFPSHKNNLTFDKNIYIKGKTIKIKQENYNFIRYLRTLQGINLFQTVSAPMDGIFLPK